MLTQDFIDRYCTPTGEVREGNSGEYDVYLVSPAAIMSVIPSCDSYEDPDVVGLERSWQETFESKREENEYERANGVGPLVFLEREGFRTPLCVLTECGGVSRFHNGNHRLAAAIDLGFTQVPIVFVEGDWGSDYDERWDLTEIRERDYPVIIPPPNAKKLELASA